MDDMVLMIISIIVAFFIPPLGLYFWTKSCDIDILIALLCMFLPPLGIIYAWVVIMVGSPLTGSAGVIRGGELGDEKEESDSEGLC
mmetsp:Transcript_5267/g.12682  ORF Transcript_5267/g.12682 Transcript_5267/m.12682 type:complete len:86 (+) Transcript_5267:93-350(+)